MPESMRRKSPTRLLTEGILGQHIALSVAAHLARTQLVPDPLRVYDAQHMAETLDVVANALVRVAPVYVQDPKAEAPRELMEAELDGARAKRAATVLALQDGRTLSAVSMKRADLRQAIAILKAVGIQELARAEPQAQEARTEPRDWLRELCSRLGEVEKLLEPPLVPSQAHKANPHIVFIARNAPEGRVANLAMQLMSAVHEADVGDAVENDRVSLTLARLRAALDEQKQTQAPKA